MSDVKQDTGSTFSVYVPTTNAYLRLGNADSAFETASQFPNAPGDLVDGAFICTDGTVNITGTEVNVTSTESIHAVYDDSNKLSSITWQLPSVGSVSYQASMAFNVNVSNMANLIAGNSLTYWLGNDASTGTGTLLWSNFGHTQNIFGGQIVNLTNNMFEIQGYGGGQYTNSTNVAVSNAVSIGQSPGALAITATGQSLIGSMGTIAKIAAAIAADLTAAEAITIGTALDIKSSEKAFKDSMIGTLSAVAAVETSVLVLQALAIAAGLVAASAAGAPKDTGLTILPGVVRLTWVGGTMIASALGTVFSEAEAFFTMQE